MTSLARPLFGGNTGVTRLGVTGTRRRRTGLDFRRTLLGTKDRIGRTLIGCRATHSGSICCSGRVGSLGGTLRDASLLVRRKGAACLRILATRRALLGTRLARITGHFARVRNMVGLCRTLNKNHSWFDVLLSSAY